MKNVQIDENDQLHCWKCGSTALKAQRTTRSKVAFGPGALLASQKYKCQRCGEYSDSGKADPYVPKKRADELAAGDRITYFGREHVVVSTESKWTGVTITCEDKDLRWIPRDQLFEVAESST